MAEFNLNQLEPVPEKFLLPSRGLFYKDHNQQILADKGYVLVRSMTLREEALIKSPRIIKTGQFLNVLLKECVKTPGIDVKKLLSVDRMALFFFLRAISYGDDYSFNATCPHCQKTNLYDIKLRELPFKYTQDTDKEPFELELRGTKVLMRFSRGIDEEINAQNQSNVITNNENQQPQEDEEQEFDIIGSLVNLTVNIEGVPRESWRKFYETLPPKDSTRLTDKISEIEPGLKTDVGLKCKEPKCRKNFQERVPINANFFRVSGK